MTATEISTRFRRALTSPLGIRHIRFALLVLGALAAAFIYRFGHDFPVADEIVCLDIIVGENQLNTHWLFAWHNEHRIPIAKLLYYLVNRAGLGDFRFALYINLAMLAASAWLFVRLRHRLGGQPDWIDFGILALFLHLGMAETLLGGFQVHFASSVLLIALIWSLLPALRERSILAMIALAVLTLLLPGNGGPTLTYAPAMALLLVLCIPLASRGRWRLAMAGIAATTIAALAVLIWLYFDGFERTTDVPFTLLAFLRAIADFASTAWGTGLNAWSRLAGAAMLIAAGLAAVLGLRRAWASPEERPLWLGGVLLLAGGATLILAIAIGRGMLGPEWARTPRYVGLLAPMLAGTLVLLDRLPGRLPRFSAVTLGSLALLMLIPNTAAGLRLAREKDQVYKSLAADVSREVPMQALATRYAGVYLAGQPELARIHFNLLSRHAIGPFADAPRPYPRTATNLAEISVPLEKVTFAGMVHGEDGWYQADRGDNHLLIDLGETREIAAVRLTVRFARPAGFTGDPGSTTQVFWASGPTQRLRAPRGYWVNGLQATPDWTLWMYQPASRIMVIPDFRPYRIQLERVTLLVPSAARPDHVLDAQRDPTRP